MVGAQAVRHQSTRRNRAYEARRRPALPAFGPIEHMIRRRLTCAHRMRRQRNVRNGLKSDTSLMAALGRKRTSGQWQEWVKLPLGGPRLGLTSRRTPSQQNTTRIRLRAMTTWVSLAALQQLLGAVQQTV